MAYVKASKKDRGRIRDFLAAYAELVERRMILDRPWTHDDLHWGHDESGEPELHGNELGRSGSRGPVTTGGWCACP